MLFGGVACFEMSTPWFAFRYDEVKSTVRFRCAVSVACWNEMSNCSVPGRKRPFHGEYIHSVLRPRPFAIAEARSTSYPRGFVMVLPRTVPEAKPTAGSPNATMSSPDFNVGAEAGLADAAGTATRAASNTAGRRRFKVCPPLSCRKDEFTAVRAQSPEQPPSGIGSAR